ncbi:MCE family protein [Prauserella endophytica]|uniref:MCE family protein n=3 Tax=Prauserella TaxID=142577 RepID=A0ABY2S7S9_9PSEU|nr:MCE family protein [Prauserella endophytica]TKG71979.1 MCE family protein [Prauserella endophytica]
MRKIAGPVIKGLIFVLVTGLATALLAVSIAGTSVGDRSTYRARFVDATSLNPGDDVRISGVRIGQVDELTVVDQHLALVTFSVDRTRELPADVTATIRYRNMVGQRYIALERGAEREQGTLAPGSELPLERTKPALDLTELFNGFQPLFQALSPADVNRLSGEIVQVLQGEGGTIESLLAHTGSLTSALADRDRVIGQVIRNLNSVLDTINTEGDALSTLVSTLQRLVSGLAGDRRAIGEAIEGMGTLTDATAGLFELARPPLKQSIAELGGLAANLETGEAELDRFLTTLPEKFTELGRISSYGAWMNFYLCRGLLLTDPPQGYTPDPPPERCTR